MKKIYYIAFLIIVLVVSASDESKAQTFDYSLLKGHPRLLMSDDDFKSLERKVTEDRQDNIVLADIHDLIIGYADEFLASPEEVSYTLCAANKRLLNMCKRALKQTFFWSYAYKLTGDKKYVEGVKDVVHTVCNFPDWNPKHFLDVGEMALTLSIAYDWLYDELTAKERKMIRESIIEKAFIPARKANVYNPKSTASISNWNQVVNTGLVCAAIVLYDKEKDICKEVIERAIPSNSKALEHIYAADGVYPEGYTYWNYGTSFNALMLAALEHVFGHTGGLDQAPGLMRTPGYMLYMAGATGAPFSYFDCINGQELAAIGMWYFADKLSDPSILANELRLMKSLKYPGENQYIRVMPMIPCVTKNLKLSDYNIAKPEKKLWHGNGTNPVVLIHTDWTFSETDKYLAFKGGQAAQSHGHMDAGSFAYDALGVRWSDDLGLESYTRIENHAKKLKRNAWSTSAKDSFRWEVYRYNNIAHSTLSVNGQNHNPKGFAPITEVYDQADTLGGRVDLTNTLSPEVKSAVRTFKLVNEDVLYIIDEITAPEDRDAHVEWRMMTKTRVDVEESREVLSKSGKRMILSTESSDPGITVEYAKWKAERPADWPEGSFDRKNSGYTVAGYKVIVPAGKTVTLTTKLSPDTEK